MKIINFIEKNFWLPMIAASIAGLLLPTSYTVINNLVIPLVMIMFLLTCLKINFLDVIGHYKNISIIIYILLIYLLIIPIGIYFLYGFINPELAIGMLLLTAIPPGAASPMLTDIFKGNISLSMAIVLIAYFVSPFSIIFLFSLLTQKTIQLNLINLFQTLLLINYLPLIISEIIKKINKSFIEKTKKYYSFINIMCICFIIYIALATQSKIIFQHPLDTVINTLWLYLLFITIYIISYFIVFWKKKSDKVAVAITKTYMNNGLALGLAITFFSPKIILLMILSEITWNTTLGPFKYFTKYLK